MQLAAARTAFLCLPGRAWAGAWAMAPPGLDAAHTQPRWSCPQLVRYSADGLLQLGPLGSTAFLPDSKCLVDDGRGRTPTLRKCEDVARPTQRLWDFTQVSHWGRGAVGLGQGRWDPWAPLPVEPAHWVGAGVPQWVVRGQGLGSAAPSRAPMLAERAGDWPGSHSQRGRAGQSDHSPASASSSLRCPGWRQDLGRG